LLEDGPFVLRPSLVDRTNCNPEGGRPLLKE
jgi:hypothetical protein